MRNLDHTKSLNFQTSYASGLDNLPAHLRPDALTNEDLDAAIAEASADRGRVPLGASGVYLISNAKSGTVYVGRAVCIRKRLGVHMSHLKHSHHLNVDMQADCAAHGVESFLFSVLTFAEGHWCYMAELRALELVKDRRCYNVQGVDYLGRAVFSEEALAMLSPELRVKTRAYRCGAPESVPQVRELEAKLQRREGRKPAATPKEP